MKLLLLFAISCFILNEGNNVIQAQRSESEDEDTSGSSSDRRTRADRAGPSRRHRKHADEQFHLAEVPCTEPGITCLNNQTVIACVLEDRARSPWTYRTVQTCTGASRCHHGECKTNPIAIKDLPLFNCTETGVFPHPYDCHQFYMCANGGPKPYQLPCVPSYGFNAKTLQCEVRLKDNQCHYSAVPKVCKTAGESGAIEGNPNMYYVCTENESGDLVPMISRCKNAEDVFHNFSCISYN